MEINVNFTYSNINDLTPLKRKLEEKVVGFDGINKEISGYYYLIDLMKKIPYMRFRNYSEFYGKLSYIVQEFPIINNGKVRYGNYPYAREDFKKYIREEFGFLPKNRILYRRFWLWFFILFFALSIAFTPLVGLIIGLILSIILGRAAEKSARKKGLVLGVYHQNISEFGNDERRTTRIFK